MCSSDLLGARATAGGPWALTKPLSRVVTQSLFEAKGLGIPTIRRLYIYIKHRKRVEPTGNTTRGQTEHETTAQTAQAQTDTLQHTADNTDTHTHAHAHAHSLRLTHNTKCGLERRERDTVHPCQSRRQALRNSHSRTAPPSPTTPPTLPT